MAARREPGVHLPIVRCQTTVQRVGTSRFSSSVQFTITLGCVMAGVVIVGDTLRSGGRRTLPVLPSSVLPSPKSSTFTVPSSRSLIFAGFRFKRARRSGPSANAVGQDLQRDVPIQLDVAGAKHFAHATRAEAIQDLIATETGACRQRHGLVVRWGEPRRLYGGHRHWYR
jgi:hypothetical protein